MRGKERCILTDIRAVYDRHALFLYRKLLLWSGSPVLAEDLTADTFVRMLEYRPVFFHPWQERRWLLTTASRLWVDDRRRERTVPVHEFPQDGSSPTPDNAADTVDKLWIRQLVSRLSPSQQDVLRFRFLDDLTHEQIADRLGISPEAARSRLHRALQELKRLVDQEERYGHGSEPPEHHRREDRR